MDNNRVENDPETIDSTEVTFNFDLIEMKNGLGAINQCNRRKEKKNKKNVKEK